VFDGPPRGEKKKGGGFFLVENPDRCLFWPAALAPIARAFSGRSLQIAERPAPNPLPKRWVMAAIGRWPGVETGHVPWT